MAVTYGFYNSVNGDRKYNAEQMAQIFDGIIEDGIFNSIGTAFSVVPSSGMIISVGAGRAWFNHTWTYNDAAITLTVSTAPVGSLKRIDAVVIEIDTNNRVNTIKIINGTESATPSRPALTNSGGVYQYALAYISLNAGVTAISATMISSVVGTDTPFVTGPLETVGVTALYNYWRTEFETWFDHLQDELDSNQAANLQHQIDDLNSTKADKTDVDAIFQIGDIKVTSRTDLGNKWALANGDAVTSTEAPDYYTYMLNRYNNTYQSWNMSAFVYDMRADDEYSDAVFCAFDADLKIAYCIQQISYTDSTSHYAEHKIYKSVDYGNTYTLVRHVVYTGKRGITTFHFVAYRGVLLWFGKLTTDTSTTYTSSSIIAYSGADMLTEQTFDNVTGNTVEFKNYAIGKVTTDGEYGIAFYGYRNTSSYKYGDVLKVPIDSSGNVGTIVHSYNHSSAKEELGGSAYSPYVYVPSVDQFISYYYSATASSTKFLRYDWASMPAGTVTFDDYKTESTNKQLGALVPVLVINGEGVAFGPKGTANISSTITGGISGSFNSNTNYGSIYAAVKTQEGVILYGGTDDNPTHKITYLVPMSGDRAYSIDRHTIIRTIVTNNDDVEDDGPYPIYPGGLVTDTNGVLKAATSSASRGVIHYPGFRVPSYNYGGDASSVPPLFPFAKIKE